MLVRVSAVVGRLPRLLRRAAPAPALALLVRCPPARGLAGVRDKVLAFFVKCEGDVGFAGVTVPASSDVAALMKAALVELRIDASPSTVTLAAAAPGSLPLDPTLLLSEALAAGALAPRAKLLVTVVTVVRPYIVGAMPHDPELGVPVAVWARMGPDAQAMASRAGQLRRHVRGVGALGFLSRHLQSAIPDAPLAVLSAADAHAGGISVLSEDRDDSLEVGLFNVPPLDDAVVLPPKSFSFARGFCVLSHPQRLNLAFEFVLAVMNRKHDESTLLSGPNGVGKSGIGLLAYLISVHLGQPVAFITRSQDWVAAAERGEGDIFLLETLWRQNADVIAASDELQPFFKDVMEDRAQPFNGAVMEALRGAVATREVPGVGIIADEVQAITKAVEEGKGALTIPLQLARAYFVSRWHDWNNKQGVIQRMSIASSHGARELKLPDSEERRLRIVEPLSTALVSVLQNEKSSPAFIADEKLRAHVAFIAGGILRRLIGGADLARGKRDSKELRAQIWHALWVPMAENCSRWLATYPAGSAERVAAIDCALDLVRGKLTWGRAKPLYDDGLVARTALSALVEPVSPVAAAVILQTVASEIRGQRVSLSTKKGAERGFELERQMRAAINPCNTLVPTKRLNGSFCSSMQLRASYALMFKGMQDIVPRDDAVAFLPHSLNFACDAILVPAADDFSSPIVILESSVTDPLSVDRVEKVRKWFSPHGIVTELRALFPSRRVVSVLVWDQFLADRKVSNAAAALSIGLGIDPVDSAQAATDAAMQLPAALTTAREIVGTSMWVESSEGEGSVSARGAAKAAIGEHVVVIDQEGLMRLHIVP